MWIQWLVCLLLCWHISDVSGTRNIKKKPSRNIVSTTLIPTLTSTATLPTLETKVKARVVIKDHQCKNKEECLKMHKKWQEKVDIKLGQDIRLLKLRDEFVYKAKHSTEYDAFHEYFLDNKHLVNEQNSAGQYALIEAIKSAKHIALRMLDNDMVDVNVVDRQGDTPLLVAISNGDVALCKVLLRRGAQANVIDAKGRTYVYRAVMFGNTRIVELLLEHKVNVDIGEVESKTTPLMMACLKGDLNMVKLLVEDGCANIQATTKNDKTAQDFIGGKDQGAIRVYLKLKKQTMIQRACSFDRFLPPKRLKHIDDESDTETSDDEDEQDGKSFYEKTEKDVIETKILIIRGVVDQLVQHAKQDAVEKFKNLFEKLGRDTLYLNTPSHRGEYPLLHVIKSQNMELFMNLVILKDINLDVSDESGQTALMLAIATDESLLMSKLLIAKGADLEARDYDGRTALYYAIHHGELDSVKLLVSRGSNVNTCTPHYGLTPLMSACAENRLDVVKYLIKRGGARLDLQDCDDETALDYAREHGSPDLVDYLVHASNTRRKSLSRKPSKTKLNSISMDSCPFEILNGAVDFLRFNFNSCKLIEFARQGDVGKFRSLLLELGGDMFYVNIPSPVRGEYPLMEAIRSHQLKIVNELLSWTCVNVDIRDAMGQTPLILAIQNKDKIAIRLLVDYGASLYKKDVAGKSPADHAVSVGDPTVIQLLARLGLQISNQHL